VDQLFGAGELGQRVRDAGRGPHFVRFQTPHEPCRPISRALFSPSGEKKLLSAGVRRFLANFVARAGAEGDSGNKKKQLRVGARLFGLVKLPRSPIYAGRFACRIGWGRAVRTQDHCFILLPGNRVVKWAALMFRKNRPLDAREGLQRAIWFAFAREGREQGGRNSPSGGGLPRKAISERRPSTGVFTFGAGNGLGRVWAGGGGWGGDGAVLRFRGNFHLV